MFSRSHQIPAAQFLIFFHLAFILAMAQSLHVFQAIQICVFLFTLGPAASVLPFTPVRQKKALHLSITVVLFSLGAFMDSF